MWNALDIMYITGYSEELARPGTVNSYTAERLHEILPLLDSLSSCDQYLRRSCAIKSCETRCAAASAA